MVWNLIYFYGACDAYEVLACRYSSMEIICIVIFLLYASDKALYVIYNRLNVRFRTGHAQTCRGGFEGVAGLMVLRVVWHWQSYVRMFEGMWDLYFEIAGMVPVYRLVTWVLLISELVVIPSVMYVGSVRIATCYQLVIMCGWDELVVLLVFRYGLWVGGQFHEWMLAAFFERKNRLCSRVMRVSLIKIVFRV